jgi:hypothetical protein
MTAATTPARQSWTSNLDAETRARVDAAEARRVARLARQTPDERDAETRRTAPRVDNRAFSLFKS